MQLTIPNPGPAMSSRDEAIFAAARLADDSVPLPDDIASAGTVRGQLRDFMHEGDTLPETRRRIVTYVPEEHDKGEPCNLLVVYDGSQYLSDEFGAAAQLDGLIARGEIPPTVAVFVDPGQLIGIPGFPAAQRSFEYDSPGDLFVRLVVDEVLPIALAGLSIAVDPARRAAMGFSSGAVAAMALAWQRPELFGGVVSHCGSFVNLRAGGGYAALIRNERKRALRMFLQSGSQDMNRVMGSWAVANFDMASALKFRGYDYHFEFGIGGHSLRHGAATFAPAMRWLWSETLSIRT